METEIHGCFSCAWRKHKEKKTRNGFRHMNMIRSICYEFASRPRINCTKLLVFTLHWASNIAEGNGVMLGITRFNLCV